MAKMASNASQKSFTNDEDDQSYHYHLVWLDKNLNNFSNKQRFNQLSEIDPKIKGFTSEEDSINYIRQQDDRNTIPYIIFIISGSLSAKVIPEIQDHICILAIFIFCTNVDNYKHLKFPKLRAICNDTYELIDKIELCIAKNNNTIDFSVFPDQQSTDSDSIPSEAESEDQYPIRNLREDQARFLWFNHMHKFMVTLEHDDDKKAKEDMINHSRKQYNEKRLMQMRIDKFNTEPLLDNKEKAISWYTDNSFIYECTNKVLRKENISQVYTYRYIIKLLCRQLKEQHKQFIRDYNEKEKKTSLRLYRAQYLKLEDILFLNRNIDNLISLNGFVSTTRDEAVAMRFLRQHLLEGCEPVLFKIDVDMRGEHCVAFADISQHSKFPDEQEVLLSIGSVFRVKSVDFDDQQELYKIHLSLSQRNQLTVIQYIEQTYATNVDSVDQSILFGKLLFDMGECESAIKYFLDAVAHLSDNDNKNRATYLNNIGICYNEMGQKSEALKYYKAALNIYKQTNNKQGFGACQHNIASIYHARGNHQEAYDLALKALEIRQNIEKASTFDLLGYIYLVSHNVEAAHDYFIEALELRLEYWNRINRYHPDIGVSYQNLGKVNSRTLAYSNAENNYLRAAEIYRHNYPQSHPLVKDITKCLEEIRQISGN